MELVVAQIKELTALDKLIWWPEKIDTFMGEVVVYKARTEDFEFMYQLPVGALDTLLLCEECHKELRSQPWLMMRERRPDNRERWGSVDRLRFETDDILPLINSQLERMTIKDPTNVYSRLYTQLKRMQDEPVEPENAEEVKDA